MIILFTVIVILLITLFVCANFLYNLALNPSFDKSRIFRDQDDGKGTRKMF